MQAWSDEGMDGWMIYNGSHGHNGDPKAALADYRKRTGANPKLYSFDLQGYGSIAFPEKNVYSLAGFSDKVLDLMGALESGESLVDSINKVEL